jgi:polyhydroxyalkanoate synthesis repressor PhaR
MNEGKNMEVTGVQNNMNSNLTAGLATEGNAELGARNANVKVIKRYQNRKLYDTHQSCYVTLDEIADMIMRGEEVVVVDNRTKKDITSSTLTQIIFEKQKRSKTVIPVSTLRDIIQVGGGTFSGFLTKTAESGSNVLSKAKADLERSFSSEENLRGAFLITQRAAEDLRRAIDEKAQTSGLSREALNATQIQLQNLNSQLSNLEKLIEVFEARASNV